MENLLSNPYAQNLAAQQLKKKDEIEILPPFRELHSSHISKVLKEFGKNTAPLSVIGHYLNYTGNHLLSYLY